jgi:hypothetical protein
VHLLLDASLSMTSGDGSKEQLIRELAILLLRLCRPAGIRGSVVALRGAGRNRIVESGDADRILHVPFDGDSPLLPSLDGEALGPAGAWRVVISDFLWPGDPVPLVRSVASDAGRLWLVQVLDDWELNPGPDGPAVLRDVETDETVELVLDESAIESYRARLNELCQTLDRACRACDATLSTVSASVGLEKLCSDWLVPAGLVTFGRSDGAEPRMTRMHADRAESGSQ